MGTPRSLLLSINWSAWPFKFGSAACLHLAFFKRPQIRCAYHSATLCLGKSFTLSVGVQSCWLDCLRAALSQVSTAKIKVNLGAWSDLNHLLVFIVNCVTLMWCLWAELLSSVTLSSLTLGAFSRMQNRLPKLDAAFASYTQFDSEWLLLWLRLFICIDRILFICVDCCQVWRADTEHLLLCAIASQTTLRSHRTI